MRLTRVLPLLALGLLASGATAHEFVVVPTQPRAANGALVALEVYSTHTMLRAEELEPPQVSAVRILHQSARVPVALTPDEARLVYRGQALAPTAGTFIVSGHRAPLTFSRTPEGSRPGSRIENPTAISAERTEKFSKALVNLSPNDTTFSTVVGDRLEIVPTANPATLRVGDELPVRVLFEGQPLGTAVFATYQGFSERAETYAFYTLAEADGTARVRITRPGLWIVRVENRRTVTDSREINLDVTRAVLAFHVH
jgi:uncharacterized GH25 family protein